MLLKFDIIWTRIAQVIKSWNEINFFMKHPVYIIRVYKDILISLINWEIIGTSQELLYIY